MKRRCALGALIALTYAAPALAQVYPGEEVTVNPGALGNGYLLYPGGKYGRHVGHLLQPGEARDGTIRLHMPVKHPKVARKPRPAAALAATAPDTTTPAPSPPEAATATRDGNDLVLSPDMAPSTPPPRRTAAAPPRPPKRTAPPPAAAPAPAPAQSASVDSLPEDSAARLYDPSTPIAAAPPPKPAPVRRAAPVTPPPAPPRRVASLPPQPAATPGVGAGLRKQGVIPFAAGASSPAMPDVNAIHSLAATLNAALAAGGQKVQLEAYAGPHGDKSPESRRLSIKRALVIRELLIEDGVPSEKIDVRAMAGADDNGPADRVDVFVRS